MKIKPRKFSGVFEIELSPITDSRGSFMRTYDEKTFKKSNIYSSFVQENHSFTRKNGTIRGLHFQYPPFDETKLIRVVRGTIFDVFVDIRRDSTTYGKWDSIELSDKNNKYLLVPSGFAHGFCTLTDNCDVIYKVDKEYNSEYESGIIWNDEDIAISWPVKNPFLSPRDSSLSSFDDFNRELKRIN